MKLGALVSFSHEALALTMIMWRKTNISNIAYFFFFLTFIEIFCCSPFALMCIIPPYKATPRSFRLLLNSKPAVRRSHVWRSSTRESTGGGWAGRRLLLPESSAVSGLTYRETLVVLRENWPGLQPFYPEGSGDTTTETHAQYLMRVLKHNWPVTLNWSRLVLYQNIWM